MSVLIPHPKPSGKRASMVERVCIECGETFQPIREDQSFCTKACRFDEKNRRFNRGAGLYPWVMLLVTDNKRRGEALNAITQSARRWRDEDRKAGRKPCPVPGDWPQG